MKHHPVTAMLCGVLWALAQYASEAHGAPPDTMTKARQGHFVRAYLGTKICMRSAGKAAHARGNDAERTQLFMLRVCGDTLFVLLRDDGMKEYQVADTIVRIARTSYYEDVLNTPEPN